MVRLTALSYVGKMDWRLSTSLHFAFCADLFCISTFARLKTPIISKVALYILAAHPTLISTLAFFFTAFDTVCNSFAFSSQQPFMGLFYCEVKG